MRPIAVLILGALLGCASDIPPTSRTGEIHDIRISERPEPSQILVETGDEIRFLNMQTEPIQIDLVAVDPEDIACERGFSKGLGGVQESIRIPASASASICFSREMEIKYNVRMETVVPGGRDIAGGLITVAAKNEMR
jgi:hypothetical protein